MKTLITSLFVLASLICIGQPRYVLTKVGSLFTVIYSDGSLVTYTLPHDAVSKLTDNVIIVTQEGAAFNFYPSRVSASGVTDLQSLYDFCLYDGGGGGDTLWEVSGSAVVPQDSRTVSGTWTGSAIGATKGGTGQTAVTTGELLYGSASNVWSKLAGVATNNALISGGVGTAPSWGKISTSHIATITAGRILYTAPNGKIITDASFTRDSTTNYTTISGVVDAGTTSSFLLNNNLFGLGFKGAALYTASATQAQYIVAHSTGCNLASRNLSNGEAAELTIDLTSSFLAITRSGLKYQCGVFDQSPAASELSIYNIAGNKDSVRISVEAEDGAMIDISTVPIFQVTPSRNLLCLNGRFQLDKGAVVASAGNLTLGTDGNIFEISGSATINAITTAGWQDGSVILFGVSGTALVKHNTAGGAGTEPFYLEGEVDCNNDNNVVLILMRSNGFWNEVARREILVNATNTTAGDAATMNVVAGSFRKDQTNSTFTLTNNQIKSTSKITATFASNLTVTGNQITVIAGTGSAVFTFWTVGVGAAAPAADTDINFSIDN